MKLETRILIEKRIARKTVRALLAAGYSLNIDNGGDDEELEQPTTDKKLLYSTLFATDEEKLYAYKNGKYFGFVWFIYGNDGYDVIADYTVNLEEVLKPVNEMADRIADQYS